MYTILLVIHTIVVLFLIMMVLIQRTDSDGMGGLGGGGNQFMTGRATANLMTRTTAILAACFMLSSLVLAVYAGRITGGSIVDAAPATENTSEKTLPAATHENKDTLTKEKAPEEKTESTESKKEAAKANPAEETRHSDKSDKVKSAPSVPKPE